MGQDFRVVAAAGFPNFTTNRISFCLNSSRMSHIVSTFSLLISVIFGCEFFQWARIAKLLVTAPSEMNSSLATGGRIADNDFILLSFDFADLPIHDSLFHRETVTSWHVILNVEFICMKQS